VEDKLHFSEAGYEVLTSLITWDKEIRTLLAADKKTPPPQSGIVFIGSSSIKRWTTLAKDFPDRPVVNRGFGGSQIFDSVTYADELVTPLQPRLVVMYAGGNDINAGKTPQRVFADFQAFVAKVHAKLPETRIAFISSAPNPARWAQIERVRELNRLVEDFTKQNPKLTFINVHPHMLAGNVEPKPDIFVADRLHMNEKGYAIWAKVVEPFLK
jgi:lysophospholipase L1-like esterase